MMIQEVCACVMVLGSCAIRFPEHITRAEDVRACSASVPRALSARVSFVHVLCDEMTQ